MAAKYWLRTTWTVGAVFYIGAQPIDIYRKMNGLMMVGMDEIAVLSAEHAAPCWHAQPFFLEWHRHGLMGQ